MRKSPFLAAFRKGVEACETGLRRRPPYRDKRNARGRVTFSRAFRNAWFRGYDHGSYPSLPFDEDGGE